MPNETPQPEALARQFHYIYERFAPLFGYETREETRQFDPATPNGQLMIAVCGEILSALRPAAVSNEQQTVKALRWSEPHASETFPNWFAFDLDLHFEARIDTSRTAMFGKFPLQINGNSVGEKFDTLDAAKDYAQKDYAARVSQALTPAQEEKPDGHIAAMRVSLAELVAAMRKYEMDVDGDPPFRHRDMMDRAEALLAATPSQASPGQGADGPTEIWLMPECCADPREGRMWSPDPFEECDDGKIGTCYVRADMLERRAGGKTFQARVGEWMACCFTPEIIADKLERSDRFIEEGLELVQACGYSADRAHALVDYVFGRPIGEPSQEVGGVMVTLAALCNPHGLDMVKCGATEMARIVAPEVIEKIRAKQASKPVGSALPVPPPAIESLIPAELSSEGEG